MFRNPSLEDELSGDLQYSSREMLWHVRKALTWARRAKGLAAYPPLAFVCATVATHACHRAKGRLAEVRSVLCEMQAGGFETDGYAEGLEIAVGKLKRAVRAATPPA